MNTDFIPFALPEIGDEEIAAVTDTLRSGWLTTGAKCQAFEKDFSAFVGARNSLAVNSATSGLHLVLEALGVGPGDKVITTPYTFTATSEVIRYLGADPYFVDIDPETFNIDPVEVEKALNSEDNVKCVLPVHMAGQPCDLKALSLLAKKANISVVEDAAHALPSYHDGVMVGEQKYSDAAVFSFYVTKTIATGEGGMVTTNSDELYSRMKTMRLHGISRDIFDRYTSDKPSWYYEVIAPGFKYNLTDLAASIGIEQLKKAEKFRERRAAIALKYNDAFNGLPVTLPSDINGEGSHSWHLYMLRLNLEELTIGRDEFISELSQSGVGASVHFIPLHMQPYWKERYKLVNEDFPVATREYSREVSLPIYPKMTNAQVERVIGAVSCLLTRHGR